VSCYVDGQWAQTCRRSKATTCKVPIAIKGFKTSSTTVFPFCFVHVNMTGLIRVKLALNILNPCAEQETSSDATVAATKLGQVEVLIARRIETGQCRTLPRVYAEVNSDASLKIEEHAVKGMGIMHRTGYCIKVLFVVMYLHPQFPQCLPTNHSSTWTR
jgi:hypothetical protein